jgi:hypothetical protein
MAKDLIPANPFFLGSTSMQESQLLYLPHLFLMDFIMVQQIP